MPSSTRLLLTIEDQVHYLHGVSDPSRSALNNWVIDRAYQDRPGNKEIQTFTSTTQKGIWMLCDWGVFP